MVHFKVSGGVKLDGNSWNLSNRETYVPQFDHKYLCSHMFTYENSWLTDNVSVNYSMVSKQCQTYMFPNKTFTRDHSIQQWRIWIVQFLTWQSYELMIPVDSWVIMVCWHPRSSTWREKPATKPRSSSARPEVTSRKKKTGDYDICVICITLLHHPTRIECGLYYSKLK